MVDIGDLKSPRRKSVWVRVPPSALVSIIDCQYGPVVTKLPHGFVPYQQWPEYGFEFDTAPGLRSTQVGIHPTGARRTLGRLCVEEYVSDDEPNMSESDPNNTAPSRMIIWRRLTRTDTPKGWYAFSKKPSRIEGFFDMKEGEEYLSRWSESARRYYKKWRVEYSDKKYRIEPLMLDSFIAAYQQGTLPHSVRGWTTEMLTQKFLHCRTRGAIQLWGVRNIATQELTAGIATITSTQHSASYYLCGFIQTATQDEPLMYGLLGHWFALCKQDSIRFLQFGRFWQKGDPAAWKGFSNFKSKFGLHYIQFLPSLIRFKR